MKRKCDFFSSHLRAVLHPIIFCAYFVFTCLALIWEVVAGLLEIPVDAPQYDALLVQLNRSHSYTEWKALASQLDDLDGLSLWRAKEESPYFSFEGVVRSMQEFVALHGRLNDGDGGAGGGKALEVTNSTAVMVTLGVLRSQLHRSLYGIHNRQLYLYRTGTKTVIHSYVSMLCYTIESVSRSAVAGDKQLRQSAFGVLQQMRDVYGTTALVLNGGVLTLPSHYGVAKALFDAALLPTVVYGSESGVLVASLIGCIPDLASIFSEANGAELLMQSSLNPTSIAGRLQQVRHHGCMSDIAELQEYLKSKIGSLTFLEAYERTGRILNLSYLSPCQVSNQPSWQLLNYLTSPNVLVYSVALCGLGVAPGQHSTGSPPLLARAVDGTIIRYDPSVVVQNYPQSSSDSTPCDVADPLERLQALFSTRYFIVVDTSLRGSLQHLLWATTSEVHHRPLHRCGTLAFFILCIPIIVLLASLQCAASLLGVSRCEWLGSTSPRISRFAITEDKGEVMRVYPIRRLSAYLQLWQTPSRTQVRDTVMEAERAVWPRLEQLRVSIAVEQALSSAISLLKSSSGNGGERVV